MLATAVLDLSRYEQEAATSTPQGMAAALAAAKAGGVRLVVLKATEGTGDVDPSLDDWAAAAKAVGLPVALYHFLHAGQAEAQADHFAQVAARLNLPPIPADLAVPRYWADWERATPTPSADDCAAFVARVQQRLGELSGVYTGDVGKAALQGIRHPILARCALWVAQYGSAPTVPSPTWLRWTMWQYTDGSSGPQPHTVAGFAGRGVDLSHYAGDRLGSWSLAQKALAGLAGAGVVGAVTWIVKRLLG